MKKNPSKEIALFQQQPVTESKETEVVEVVVTPDVMIQVSPAIEEKLKSMGITIEGLQIFVTVPGSPGGEPSFKRNIFTNDPYFEEASNIKFFEKNNRIFLKITKKPTAKNKKGTSTFYEIVPSEWGTTAQGYIRGDDKERLKEYGLTGQE